MRKSVSFVLGGPCCGKGFFGNKVVQASKNKIAALSAGDLIRSEMEKSNSFSMKISDCINKGGIIPVYSMLIIVRLHDRPDLEGHRQY